MALDISPAVISTVGISIATGLAVIARKEPVGYNRILWGLRVIFAAILIGISCFDLGNEHMFTAMVDFIDPSKLAAAREAKALAKLPVLPILLMWLAAVAYCEFLGLLPYILSSDQPGKK